MTDTTDAEQAGPVPERGLRQGAGAGDGARGAHRDDHPQALPPTPAAAPEGDQVARARARAPDQAARRRRHRSSPDKVAGQAVGKAKSLAKGPLHLVRGTGEAEKMLKNAKTEYFSEHEEIATYTAIETLAESLGDAETAKLARAIRRDEERMANYLAKQIPVLTKAVVDRGDPGAGAAPERRGPPPSQASTAVAHRLAGKSRASASKSRSRSRSKSRGAAARPRRAASRSSAAPPSARARRARRPRAARRGSPGGRSPPAPRRAGARSAPGARRRRAR